MLDIHTGSALEEDAVRDAFKVRALEVHPDKQPARPAAERLSQEEAGRKMREALEALALLLAAIGDD